MLLPTSTPAIRPLLFSKIPLGPQYGVCKEIQGSRNKARSRSGCFGQRPCRKPSLQLGSSPNATKQDLQVEGRLSRRPEISAMLQPSSARARISDKV